jgi:hypothetical protein
MPYVPSKKTNPPAVDRELMDPLIYAVAEKAADVITTNEMLVSVYVDVFMKITGALIYLLDDDAFKNVPDNDSESNAEQSDPRESVIVPPNTPESHLACAIWETGEKYDYEGAFLGELNYAMTMFIQKVPEIKVENGDWDEELRYWLYARTAEALKLTSCLTLELWLGIGGVFDDVLAEYKYQVNGAYEVEQILKSGHCYFGPYYRRPVEVVTNYGDHVGYMDIMLKRSDETLHKDLLGGKVILEMRSFDKTPFDGDSQ